MTKTGGTGKPARSSQTDVFTNSQSPVGSQLVVRVEGVNALDRLLRVLAEVLLVDDPLLVDQEGHHARVAVLRRPGEHREAARHPALRVDVVLRAAGRVLALRGQQAEEVAVVRRLSSSSLVRVALLGRVGDQRAERALRLALRDRPVEPVVLAGGAEDLARERGAARRRVPTEAYSRCASTNSCSVASVESSLRPTRRFAISSTPASTSKRQPSVLLHERDRERPAVVAEQRDRRPRVAVLEGDLLADELAGRARRPRGRRPRRRTGAARGRPRRRAPRRAPCRACRWRPRARASPASGVSKRRRRRARGAAEPAPMASASCERARGPLERSVQFMVSIPLLPLATAAAAAAARRRRGCRRRRRRCRGSPIRACSRNDRRSGEREPLKALLPPPVGPARRSAPASPALRAAPRRRRAGARGGVALAPPAAACPPRREPRPSARRARS